MAIAQENITGLVLAGGRASRMHGEDKGLLRLHDKPMIEYTLDVLAPQTSQLLISANRNLDRYSRFGHPVITDNDHGTPADFRGPLAGILAALKQCPTSYLVVTPCDTPLLDPHYVERLNEALSKEEARAAVAFSGTRIQPLLCMLSKTLVNSLDHAFNKGLRKVETWMQSIHPAAARFDAQHDMFLNINTPDELQRVETLLTETKPLEATGDR